MSWRSRLARKLLSVLRGTQLQQFGAAGVGLFLLAADLTIGPPAPYPWLLGFTGSPGFFFQTILSVAAAVSLASWRKPERFIPLFHLAALGIAIAPMVVVQDWTIPLLRLWRMATQAAPASAEAVGFAGSPDATWTLVLVLPVLAALLAHVLAAHLERASRILSLLVPGVVVAATWLSAGVHAVVFGSAGTSRILVSAVMHSVAIPMLAFAWAGMIHPSEAPLLAGWPRSLSRAIPVGLLLLVYFLIKLETTGYSATDENIYFYMAQAFANGQMPYRDFFFAHPPLHLLLPGLLVMIFGFSFTLLKLVPVACSLLSGLFIYLTGRRGSMITGLLSSALFLFALEQLQASTNMTGINITVMFLCAALYWSTRARGGASGLSAGLAVVSGIYAVGPALALLVVVFFYGWRTGAKFLASFAGVVFGVNLLFYLLFGDPYLEQVYTYHFLKESASAQFLRLRSWDLVVLLAAGGAFVGVVGVCGQLLRRSAGLPCGLSFWNPMRNKLLAPLALVAALGLFALHQSITPEEPAGLSLALHDLRLFFSEGEFQRFFFFHPHLLLAPGALVVCVLLAWLVSALMGHKGAVWPAAVRSAVTSLGVVTLAGACLTAGAAVQLALIGRTYTFYYTLLIPGLALLGGLSWSFLVAAVSGGAIAPLMGGANWFFLYGEGQDQRESREGEGGRCNYSGARGPFAWPVAGARGRGVLVRSLLVLVCAVMLAANMAWVPVGLAVGAKRFPEEQREAGALNCYRVPPKMTVFSPLIHRFLLSSCRLKGSMEPGIWHYLWKKSWRFSTAEEVAQYIRDNSQPGETILGSSLITPLLGLLSGRELAAGYIDTNTKRFKAGMTEDPEAWRRVCRAGMGRDEARCRRIAAEREMWEKVCRTPLRFIVSGPRSFFTWERMRNHPVVRRYFTPVRFFNEPELNMSGKYPIVLFRRTADAPVAGAWCSM